MSELRIFFRYSFGVKFRARSIGEVFRVIPALLRGFSSNLKFQISAQSVGNEVSWPFKGLGHSPPATVFFSEKKTVSVSERFRPLNSCYARKLGTFMQFFLYFSIFLSDLTFLTCEYPKFGFKVLSELRSTSFDANFIEYSTQIPMYFIDL